MTSGQTQRYLFLVFALSGFSGLIYESVWSHYLKLFLGHAAYAQALVLVIFMGGMALGAWLTSRYGHRFANLLLAYAAIEGVIGIAGLLFHPLYQFIHTASFEQIIPALGEPQYVYLYKFIIASFVILPQSVLLGATLPLMSGGFLRKYPDAPGKAISYLYFCNSLGAAAALPISAFYLIPKLGLPGTILTAALVNIGLAMVMYGLVKNTSQYQVSSNTDNTEQDSTWWPRLLLAASLFTGMASFIYEVAWLRMLSMVIGASTHAFELMLSAFITGLAIGGYWIRGRIDKLKDTVRYVALVQIVMGLLALSTIYLYQYSYEFMAFIMNGLAKTGQGYVMFSLASHSIAMLIMLPATICAGMTLPLFTYILLKRGCGEKSIGQIYSANTIGAIIGVVFTIFIGMPYLGLKGSILTGAGIDILVGLVLLRYCMTRVHTRYLTAGIYSCLLIFAVTALFYQLDPKRMASGVFRHGRAMMDDRSEIRYHRDGRTSSVTVSDLGGETLTLYTNGKPDASINITATSQPTLDESTMTMLAAIPLALFPEARTVANIGMGSGMTAHTALALPGIERVDTIEIEPAMIAGARHFGPKTSRAFDDPRSRIYIEDARTFFSTHGNKYDIIISEPSNPWVSGVSSLFTREFYRSVTSYLNPDGLFVQWIQIYEFDHDLLVSVLKALSVEFPYYSIYFADNGNLILVASLDRPIGPPQAALFANEAMATQLASVYINNQQDLDFRFLGDQALYNGYIKHYPVPLNSDYFPVLDLRAPESRFLGMSVSGLLDLRLSAIPLLEILYDRNGVTYDQLTTNRYYPATENAHIAKIAYGLFTANTYPDSYYLLAASVNYLLTAASSCGQQTETALWIDSFFLLINSTAVYLGPEQTDRIITEITQGCGADMLTDEQQNWIELFRTMGHRDIPGLVSAASLLLESPRQLNTHQKKYIMTALLAGLVRLGDHDQAERLWKDSMAGLFTSDGDIPLEIRLILALITR
jgi:spermidine synthase